MISKLPMFCIGLCLSSIQVAAAQDVPSLDILKAITRQVTSKPLPTAITFDRRSDAASSACRLQSAQMNLTRDGRTVRTFSVLVDDTGRRDSPQQIFATVTRMTVNSDGAGRTYHPEDPLGEGVCQRIISANGRASLRGICALDQFSNGGTYLFSGTQKLSKSMLAGNWSAMWPSIRDKSLKSFVLADLVGPEVPRDFYLFHWKERGLTAVFRNNIIQKDRAGYPCRFNDSSELRYGYFISSTTLQTNAAARDDGCTPNRFLDSETVPFVVLPKGGFGKVRIGDIAILRHKNNVVYAVVGDAGPPNKFGEGSIALNAKLLSKFGDPLANMKETWALDIQGTPVSILVLGNTRHKLNNNFSPQNIEAVARQELASWDGSGDPLARFEACRTTAPVNSSR